MPAVRICGNRVAKGATQTHVVINRGNARAEDWAWSSLRWQGIRGRIHAPEFSSDGPVERGRNWQQTVNRPMTDAEMLSHRAFKCTG